MRPSIDPIGPEPGSGEERPDGSPPVDFSAAQTVCIPKPAGGWNGTRLYEAAEKAWGPKPHVDKLAQLVICRKCEGLSRPRHGKPTQCAAIRCGSTDVVSYPEFAASIPGTFGGGATPHGSPARPPEEWRSADLDDRLRRAAGWGGAAERLTHRADRPPTDLEILEELGDAWSNEAHIHETADGYRVRGGPRPAFWVGTDDRRRPTCEGGELAARVRRALGLPTPGATGWRA